MSFNDFLQWLGSLFSKSRQPDAVSPTRPTDTTPATPPSDIAETEAPITPPPAITEPPVTPKPAKPTIISITIESNKVPLNKDVVFQITTSPPKNYHDCKVELIDTNGVSLINGINDEGEFTLQFTKASKSDNDIQTIRVSNTEGLLEKVVTVSLMKLFWSNHPGRKNICDDTRFTNQCAIRMGATLELSGIKLSQDRRVLRRCTTEYRTYKHHKDGKVKGHVLAAQELANWIKSQTSTFGQCNVVHSKDEIMGRSGIIFFRDGWGTTDHIDVWDGEALVGGFPSYFDSDFKELWFWDIY